MWKQDPERAQDQHDPDLALAIADLVPLSDLDVPDGITSIGRTILIKGEIRSGEHLIIEGRVEGQVAVPDHGVAVGRHGVVGPEVFARTITVRGTATGNLTAIETLEILETGNVEGRLVAAGVSPSMREPRSTASSIRNWLTSRSPLAVTGSRNLPILLNLDDPTLLR